MQKYLAVPAYLYSRFSAVGIQGGYEYRKINLRLDFSVVEEFVGDQSQSYVIYSLGVLFPQDLKSIIRIYEGVTFGEERSLDDTFDGRVLLPDGTVTLFRNPGA